MVKCKRCGKEKDDAASYCPECQTSIRNRLIKVTTLILILILLIIAIFRYFS